MKGESEIVRKRRLNLDYIGKNVVLLLTLLQKLVGNILHRNDYFHLQLHDYVIELISLVNYLG
jgi:hypothetical protein